MKRISYHEFKKYVSECLHDVEDIVEEIIEAEYEFYCNNLVEILFCVENIKDKHKKHPKHKHGHKYSVVKPATHLSVLFVKHLN